MLERYLKIYKSTFCGNFAVFYHNFVTTCFCIFYPYEIHNVDGFLLAALVGF